MNSSYPTSSGSSTNSSILLERPDRYEFDSKIALSRERAGSTFRAFDTLLRQPVVIKLISPNTEPTPASRKRFERKARKLCQLNHPNIVPINDFGYHHGLAFLAREDVGGTTLEAYLSNKQRLSFEEFAPIAASVLEGLSEVHPFKIAHGDLQATNILLSVREGGIRRVALAGFALPDLQTQQTSDETERRTRRIEKMGAVAPERLRGDALDVRVDLYSFGLTAYRMLTGRHAFEEDQGLDSLYQHLHESPPLLTDHLPDHHDVPEPVAEFVHRLLAKEPDDRPKDARQASSWLFASVEDNSIFRLEGSKGRSPIDEGDNSSSTQLLTSNPTWIFNWDSGSFRSLYQDEDEQNESPQPATGEATDEEGTSSRHAGDSNSDVSIVDATTASISNVQRWPRALVSALKMSSEFRWLMTSLSGAILGLAVGLLVLAPSQDDSPKSERAGAHSDSKNDREETREEIKRILDLTETGLENKEFETARYLLDSIDKRLHKHPELLAKSSQYRSQLKLGRILIEARQFERAGELKQAIKAYKKALALNPDNAAAGEKLQELGDSVGLHITSNEKASVFLNGELVGTTPVHQLEPAEDLKIAVRRFGYDSKTQKISPDPATEIEFHAELEPSGSSDSSEASSQPEPTPVTSDLMDMSLD